MTKKRRRKTLEPGRVFAVPLLRGGYGFGYFTYCEPKSFCLTHIIDYVGETAEVPEDVQELPLAREDYVVSRTEFRKGMLPYLCNGEKRLVCNRCVNGLVGEAV